MFDENELNPKLTGEQAAIEESLRGVTLPNTAIDHDTVMYRAGWAAAMAKRDTSVPTSNSKGSRLWPALAMTFATTTAACLLVILLPPKTDGNSVAVQDSPPGQNRIEILVDEGGSSRQDDNNTTTTSTQAQKNATRIGPSFSMAKIFTGPIEELVADRNKRFDRRLAEASSPSNRFRGFRNFGFLPDPDDDWDLEPTQPLTPRSSISFSPFSPYSL